MNEKKIGVALSGGGYRATAFHVGTLRALHKMGILSQVDVLSTISGGSITGAAFCLHQGDFSSFDEAMLNVVSTKSVIHYILTSWMFLRFALLLFTLLLLAAWLLFNSHPWFFLLVMTTFVALLIIFQFRIFPVSKVIERAYNEFFFNNAKLSDLPMKPELAIGATNLQTCVPFTFSPRKMDDSTYAKSTPPIQFKHSEFPISRAVMASTCVPFAFTPVKIDPEYFVSPEDQRRCHPILVDGGVYDNQGVHKITHLGSSYECNYIIVSDAGNRLPFERSYNNTYTLLLRTVNIFMVRIKNFQMALHLYRDGRKSSKQKAYLSLGWDLTSCVPGFIRNLMEDKIAQSVIDAHGIPTEWIEKVKENELQIRQLLETRVGYVAIVSNDLSAVDMEAVRNVGTNLTRIPIQTAQLLARHAANMTELQVKLYCPALLTS